MTFTALAYAANRAAHLARILDLRRRQHPSPAEALELRKRRRMLCTLRRKKGGETQIADSRNRPATPRAAAT